MNRGISSGFTKPFSMSSAAADYRLERCLELTRNVCAVNSRRFLSAKALSVTSKASMTAPMTFPPDSMRLMSKRLTRPSFSFSTERFSVAHGFSDGFAHDALAVDRQKILTAAVRRSRIPCSPPG